MLLVVSLLGLCMTPRLPHLLTPLQQHFRSKHVKRGAIAVQCVRPLSGCCRGVAQWCAQLSRCWVALTLGFLPSTTYSPSYRHSFISPFLVQHLVVGERQKRGDFFFSMLPTIITEIKKHCCIHQLPKEQSMVVRDGVIAVS